jgi:hypothetical protein
MLSRDEIQCLVFMRLLVCSESCNSFHINQVDGQIRALLCVLNDGKVIQPGGDARMVLDTAGIPWKPNGPTGWYVDDDWLRERGCKVDVYGIVSHPKLGAW